MQENIKEIVDRETLAWNTQDVNLLLSIFHPDMVWVWPKDENSHDPVEWETAMGKFDEEKWKKIYEGMFAQYALIRNDRSIVKIVETNERDGGFAVVDIDTVWQDRVSQKTMRWRGRTCKTYVQTKNGYKMIAQTGVLVY